MYIIYMIPWKKNSKDCPLLGEKKKKQKMLSELLGFPCGSAVKNLPALQELQVLSLGHQDPLEEDMATYSSTLAWRIPWTEEPGRLQSMGSQRVRTV